MENLNNTPTNAVWFMAKLSHEMAVKNIASIKKEDIIFPTCAATKMAELQNRLKERV